MTVLGRTSSNLLDLGLLLLLNRHSPFPNLCTCIIRIGRSLQGWSLRRPGDALSSPHIFNNILIAERRVNIQVMKVQDKWHLFNVLRPRKGPVSCWFIWLTLQPWWWKRHAPPKCQLSTYYTDYILQDKTSLYRAYIYIFVWAQKNLLHYLINYRDLSTNIELLEATPTIL
jgi:hypothetical protein